MRRRRAAGLLALLVAPLVGCASAGWDASATETALRASLLAAHPGAAVEVRCPDALPDGDAPGRCAATVAGVDLVLQLREEGEDELGFDVVGPVVSATELADLVAARLDADLGGAPSVDCGPAPLLVPDPGVVVACRATADGRIHGVDVRWVDEAGVVEVVGVRPDAG